MELSDALIILNQFAKFRDAQMNAMGMECVWVGDAFVILAFKVQLAHNYLS